MTLFPSAFRSDRLWATGTPAHPLRGLRNLVKQLLSRPRVITAPALSVVPTHANGTRRHRPEPRLKWTDPRRAPDGAFAASAILNVELASMGVPRRGTSWDVMSDFALSYDGYGYWDDLHELANRVVQRWTRSRMLPGTLDELRACLFYEQRRWHHFGEDPSGRSAEYMWAIVDAISALVTPINSGTPVTPIHSVTAGGPVTALRSVTAAADHLAELRPTTAAEAHVKLVASPGPSEGMERRTPTMRPMAAGTGRLVPMAAAEAHVRLVSSIEGESMARHPSGRAPRRSSEHPSMHLSDHASTTRIRDLRPMPSAEPLPKPPVIVRRTRSASGAPNRPGGSVNATRSSNGAPPSDGAHPSNGAHPSDGARRRLEPVPSPAPAPAAAVTPLCHEFRHDVAAYLTWVENHPEGYVLNQPRSAPSKPPTLHRIGCAVVARRGETEALTAGAARVCGPSAEALEAWSAAQGTGRPTVCRRCCP